jgi:hypothetical protein
MFISAGEPESPVDDQDLTVVAEIEMREAP